MYYCTVERTGDELKSARLVALCIFGLQRISKRNVLCYLLFVYHEVSESHNSTRKPTN